MKTTLNFATWGVFLVLIHHISYGAKEQKEDLTQFTVKEGQTVLLAKKQIRDPRAFYLPI